MLKITGHCSITKIKEISPKALSATFYFGTKQQNSDEWDNHFFNGMIVGEGVTEVIQKGIKNKDRVEVEGLLKTRTYQEKTYTELIIFSVKKAEPKEEKGNDKGKFDR